MLNRTQRENLLCRIREIGRNHLLTDVHVHPFEVLAGGLRYRPQPDQEGVYSSGTGIYQPPAAAVANDEHREEKIGTLPEPWRTRALTLGVRRLYAHTGPKVLGDRMAASGIGRAVLLPVASAGGGDEDPLPRMAAMFGHDPRFILGCCVPVEMPEERIEETVRRARVIYGARVIKIHPALAGIDAGSASGRERIERILDAARQNRLPVIVHGGRSTILHDSKAAGYATLEKLSSIDWSLAAGPVVIAHAGMFGHAPQEVEDRRPLLQRLMAQHHNLYVDLSGIGPAQMNLLLGKIDCEKVLFGSDALYFDQAEAVVTLLQTLKTIGCRSDEHFIRIAGHNARHLIPEGEYRHAVAAENQIYPIC